MPPEETLTVPKFDTTVLLAVPPDRTFIVPEEITMTPLLTCPAEMFSVWKTPETVVIVAVASRYLLFATTSSRLMVEDIADGEESTQCIARSAMRCGYSHRDGRNRARRQNRI